MMSVSAATGRPPSVPSPLLSPGSSPDGHTAFSVGPLVPHTPSTWVPDATRNACKTCHSPFSFFVRRHHCRFCRDVFCDACSDYRLLARDPKDRTLIVSVRACRGCFDKCKGRRRRGPLKPSTKPSTTPKPSTSASTKPPLPSATSTAKVNPAPPRPSPSPAKSDLQQGASYYVKRQPSKLSITTKQAPSPKPITTTTTSTSTTTTAPTDEEEEEEEEDEEEDEEDVSSEGSDEVIIDEDEEFDYNFPIPSPSDAAGLPTIHPDPTQPKAGVLSPSKAATKASPTSSSSASFEVKGSDERLSVSVDKDEFEREGDDSEGRERSVGISPREAELMNIPADALGSVKHSVEGEKWAATHKLPVIRSEEAYEEGGMKPAASPITGVHELLELRSPSTVPQPLLNALNTPQASPHSVANIVEALVASENGVSQPQPRAQSQSKPNLPIPPRSSPSPAASLGRKAALKAPPPPPAPTAPIAEVTSPSASTSTFTPASVAPSVAPATAAEVVEAVMEGAHLTHEEEVKQMKPAPVQTSTSTADESTFDRVMDGMGSLGHTAAVEVQKLRTEATSSGVLKGGWMRPLPLGLLGLGFLLLFGLLPLTITIPLSVLLVVVPLTVSHFLFPVVHRAPTLSVSRDFPELAAEHSALEKQRELSAWDRADQRLDGLAALPSPSLTKQYASQTEVEAPQVEQVVIQRPRPKLVV